MGSHGLTWTDQHGYRLDVGISSDGKAWVGIRDMEGNAMSAEIPADRREEIARALAGWAQAAQPDRPEPMLIDESQLRVGDEIEVTLIGSIEAVEDGCPFLVHPDGSRTSIAGGYSGARWRVLRRAKPEVDTDEVDALYEEIYLTDEGQRQVRDNQDGRADEYRAIAEGLVRSGKVRVVSTDE